MNKATATLEVLSSNRGIVTIEINGEWAGSCRVDRAKALDLYETAFKVAEQNSAIKGARLEAFRVL